MKKYMLIYIGAFGTFVNFYDDYQDMENRRMDLEVSCGCYTECYYRDHIDGDPNAPEAYISL